MFLNNSKASNVKSYKLKHNPTCPLIAQVDRSIHTSYSISFELCRCKELFRFTKMELERLQSTLRIPDEIRGKYRGVFSGLEGLCILLRRLAFPCRLCDLEPLFGRGKAELSIIVNTMLLLLYDEWNHLFTNLDHHQQHWVTEETMEEACTAIHDKGWPLSNVWGFIDGTI